jgi:type IV pilus assembly protein PilQ
MKKWILLIIVISFNLLAQEKKPAVIQGINFIQEGEISKLIIDLDKRVFAERSHIKDDKQIILDLRNAIASQKVLRGVDTSEFTGSTVYISPYKKPGTENDLRIAIQLRENVRSILEQKNNRIVLSIENRFGVFSKTKLRKADEATITEADINDSEIKISVPKSNSVEDILENLTQSGVKKYVGKKISINVNQVPYQEILRMISDTSGFNIIIDDAVNSLPPLTISLTNIPWDQALDTILSLGELVAFKTANILTIKTALQAREERQREVENQNANRQQEPLVTKIFPVSFADPQNLITILNDYLTPDRGRIQVDQRTSNVIVKDTIEVIERMKKIIETLDTETPQVLIESKIIEATENYSFRAGLGRGGLQFGYDPLSENVGADSGTFSFSSATDANNPTLIGASISVFRRLTDLEFNLELMESEQKGRIISSPKIITQNNQPATISSNDTRRVRTVVLNNGGGSQENLQDLTATILLNVTPRVTNDGSISLQVQIQKDGFIPPATQDEATGNSSKTINTNVLVDNGSTIVIGGLYQTDTNEIEAGIPFLKDLPLVGWLFRNAYNPTRSRNELIVFLTPRIVNQEEAGLVNRESGVDI